MAFVGDDDDPLAELVWSPRKGITVRSAVGSVLEKKTSIFFEAELSKMVHSPTYSLATENFIDKVAQKRDLADEIALVTASKNDAMNTQMCKLDIGRDSGSSEKMVEMNTTVGPNSLRDESNSNTINRVIEATTGSNSPGLEDGRRSNVILVSDELQLNTRPVEFMHGGFNDNKTCGSLDINEDNGPTCSLRPIKDNMLQGVQESVSACAPLEKLETTGTKLQEQFQLEVCPVNKASQVRSYTSKRKGKEKSVVFNDDMKEEVEEGSDSYEASVESCNTARLVGARKKRAEQLIAGCKRVKLQIPETPDFTPFTRSDGSFVKWISTLTKGLSRPVENGSEKKGLIVCSKVQDNKRGNMGFQSLFGSLYQPNLKAQDQILLSSDDHNASESCKEPEVVEKPFENFGSNNTRLSSQDDLVADEQKMVSNESLNQRVIEDEQDPLVHSTFLKRSIASVSFDCKASALPKTYFSHGEKKVDESVMKPNQLNNLWLTHFCPKSSGFILNSAKSRLGKELEKSHIPLDAELNCTVKRIEGKKINPMASIFAKRMDVLKQIMQTNLVDKATSSTTTTCFFCGIFGHGLRNCPQVTDTEVDELLNDMSTYSGAEESCCFCIKCFQLNHWAVACPKALSVNKSEKLHVELPDDKDVNLEIGERSASLRRISPNVEKISYFCAGEFASKSPTISHPCNSLGKQVVDNPRGIFEVVRNLRLSRTDILKCMYSMVSTSYLDGYYVRLRLGKPEEGLGGTGYHVACISGLHGNESGETSTKPVSVIVRGIRYSIESQYISNQDFIEDELMAWWSETIRGGGKIPSEEELMLKVKEKRRLGL